MCLSYIYVINVQKDIDMPGYKDILFHVLYVHLWLKEVAIAIPELSNVSKSKSSVFPALNDMRILDTPIYSTQSVRNVECASICHRTPACLSFQFNLITKQCRLFDRDFVGNASVTDDVGWRYYMNVKGCKKFNLCVGYKNTMARTLCGCLCFRYIDNDVIHRQAEIDCTSNGSELARIDRELKQYCVENLLVTEDKWRYFQGTRGNLTLDWYYDDGEQMEYFNWNSAEGQPANAADEVFLALKVSKNYRWHDVYDGSRLALCLYR